MSEQNLFLQPKMEPIEFTDLKLLQIGKPLTLSRPFPVEKYHASCALLQVSNNYGYMIIGCDSGVKKFSLSAIQDAFHGDNSEALPKAEAEVPSTDGFVNILKLSLDEKVVAVYTSSQRVNKVNFYNALDLSLICSWSSETGVISILPHSEKAAFIVLLESGLVHVVDYSEGESKTLQLDFDKVSCIANFNGNLVVGTEEGKVILNDGKAKQLENEKVIHIQQLNKEELLIAYAREGNTVAFYFYNSVDGSSTHFYDDTKPFPNEKRLLHVHSSILGQWEDWNGLVITVFSASDETCYFIKIEGQWSVVDLDEGGRIELPMPEKESETGSFGLAFDLTANKVIPAPNPDEKPFPAKPIAYVYTDQGALLSYHVFGHDYKSYEPMKSVKVLPLEKFTVKKTPAFSFATPKPRNQTAEVAKPTSMFSSTGSKPAQGSLSFGFGTSTPLIASDNKLGQKEQQKSGLFSNAATSAAPPKAVNGGLSFSFGGSSVVAKDELKEEKEKPSFGSFSVAPKEAETPKPAASKFTPAQPSVAPKLSVAAKEETIMTSASREHIRLFNQLFTELDADLHKMSKAVKNTDFSDMHEALKSSQCFRQDILEDLVDKKEKEKKFCKEVDQSIMRLKEALLLQRHKLKEAEVQLNQLLKSRPQKAQSKKLPPESYEQQKTLTKEIRALSGQMDDFKNLVDFMLNAGSEEKKKYSSNSYQDSYRALSQAIMLKSRDVDFFLKRIDAELISQGLENVKLSPSKKIKETGSSDDVRKGKSYRDSEFRRKTAQLKQMLANQGETSYVNVILQSSLSSVLLRRVASKDTPAPERPTLEKDTVQGFDNFKENDTLKKEQVPLETPVKSLGFSFMASEETPRAKNQNLTSKLQFSPLVSKVGIEPTTVVEESSSTGSSSMFFAKPPEGTPSKQPSFSFGVAIEAATKESPEKKETNPPSFGFVNQASVTSTPAKVEFIPSKKEESTPSFSFGKFGAGLGEQKEQKPTTFSFTKKEEPLKQNESDLDDSTVLQAEQELSQVPEESETTQSPEPNNAKELTVADKVKVPLFSDSVVLQEDSILETPTKPREAIVKQAEPLESTKENGELDRESEIISKEPTGAEKQSFDLSGLVEEVDGEMKVSNESLAMEDSMLEEKLELNISGLGAPVKNAEKPPSMFNASTTSSTGPGTSSNAFGSSNTFGQSSTVGGFGQTSTFGGFGSTQGSNFEKPAAFGQTSTPSAFGSPAAFGAPAAAPAFGSPSSAPAFGQSTGPVSAFGQPSQLGFGSPTAGPGFGQPSSLGSAPTFGSASPFGFAAPQPFTTPTASTGKLFGAGASTSSGVSFGQLAQNTQNNSPFGGSSTNNTAPPSNPNFSQFR